MLANNGGLEKSGKFLSKVVRWSRTHSCNDARGSSAQDVQVVPGSRVSGIELQDPEQRPFGRRPVTALLEQAMTEDDPRPDLARIPGDGLGQQAARRREL